MARLVVDGNFYVFKIVSKGLDPRAGRMGQEALALPYQGQGPVDRRVDEGHVDGLVGGDALTDAPRQQGDAHAGDDHFYLQIPVVALADDLGMGHDVLVERVYVWIEGKGRRIVYEGLVFDVVEGQLAGLRQPVVGRHDDFEGHET